MPSFVFEDSQSWTQPLCWSPGHMRSRIGFSADSKYWSTDTWTNDSSDNLSSHSPASSASHPHEAAAETNQLCPNSWAAEFMDIRVALSIRTFHMTQKIKNLPEMQKTWVWSLVGEENGWKKKDKKKIGLKIYWARPCPSEQDPVSPSVSLSYQEASITDWKPLSEN